MTTVAWSTVLPPGAPPDLGTGANPTAFGDVGQIYGVFTCNGDTVTRTIPVRYAPATAAGAIAAQTWTVDDTVVNLNAATDFTANGNALTYSASGLPAGVTINSAGLITGTPTAVLSGSVVVTATDAYGRLVTSTFTLTMAAAIAATFDDAIDTFDSGILTFDEAA